MKRKLKFLLFVNVVILSIVFTYKLYLISSEKDFQSMNISNIEVLESTKKYEQGFSFAVLGNVKKFNKCI